VLDKDLPLVSVLIPLFNHEKYIVQCMASVLTDDYPNKELIVIDDGSRDGSFEVSRNWHAEYAAQFPGRFEISSRPNRGVSATLNELLSLAQGEIITLLASDDFLLPGGIRARVDYLRSHPDKMAAVGDFEVVDAQGVLLHEHGVTALFKANRAYLNDEQLIGYELMFRWCLAGAVYMGRKELFEKVGGYDENLVVEDLAFCLKLIAENLIGFVDTQVAAYRVHGEGKINHLKYNQSMLKTVCDNMDRFSGMRRVYLYGLKLRFIGKIAQLTKEKPLMGFLCRKAGQVIIIVTKRVYWIFARSIHRRKELEQG
jgi:glycosyltransferase involved in cell wall biosynthesis